MTASGHILTDISDGILTITFNRPERKNALTVAMYEEIVAAMKAAETDANVRVIMFQGAGGIFTSGNDVADFMNTPPAGPDSPVFQLLNALVHAEKPIVAAVSGPAIGIGVTMLLHCDLVYASDTVRFQAPFVNLGLCPEGGSNLLLPLTAGHQKAAEILMLGEPFGAEAGVAAGFVNGIYTAETLNQLAREKALKLAEKPMVSLKLTKQLLRHGLREQTSETLLREGAYFVERLGSPAAMEAFGAFFEKRKPDFRKVGE